MITAAPAPPDGPAPAPERGSARRFARHLLRAVLAVTLLLIAAMWVYAFGFASKKGAYRVDDESWRVAARQICERYQAQRLELVDVADGWISEPTPEQMLRRADIVDRATDLLTAQLAELEALPLASDRDRSLVADYAGFWRMVLGDRRAYTAGLRELRLEPYYETAVENAPVSNVVADFSVANEIRACSPPLELTSG